MKQNYKTSNNSKPMAYDTLLGTVNSFIDWRNKQKTTKRGGKTMYDVKGHYQYLHENEMFDYWSKHVNCA